MGINMDRVFSGLMRCIDPDIAGYDNLFEGFYVIIVSGPMNRNKPTKTLSIFIPVWMRDNHSLCWYNRSWFQQCAICYQNKHPSRLLPSILLLCPHSLALQFLFLTVLSYLFLYPPIFSIRGRIAHFAPPTFCRIRGGGAKKLFLFLLRL